jgi:hypothetical protein
VVSDSDLYCEARFFRIAGEKAWFGDIFIEALTTLGFPSTRYGGENISFSPYGLPRGQTFETLVSECRKSILAPTHLPNRCDDRVR